MSVEKMSITIKEATTRYVNITCKNRGTGEPFDFTGYTVQTHLRFGDDQRYLNTAIVENLLSYKIPADASLGKQDGIAETRIFKNGDVFEVLRIDIKVSKADKPDLAPNE